MINQELFNYVNQQLVHGVAKEEIKQVLLNAGWQENDINDAINQATNLFPETIKSVEAKRISGNFFLILIFIVVLIVGGGAFGYFIINKNTELPITTSTPITSQSRISTPAPIPTPSRTPTPAQILQEKIPDQPQVQKKIRILIVPGHESNYGGAEFGNIKERDLVMELGQDLEQFLKADDSYQVFITRNAKTWDPIFTDYFKNNWNNIVAWKKASRLKAISVSAVSHNNIPADVAVRLYGINKWSNENDIDLVMHVHMNDYWGHPENIPGKYSGFVIYLPAQQYSNSTTTGAIAKTVFNRLAKYNPVSNLRQESTGLVSDAELIAVGANNTSDAASMLIEYDYIYRPQFVNSKIRSLALKDLAYQTYLGLQDFFSDSNGDNSKNLYNPSLLHAWNNPVTGKNSDPLDIYALQTALILDGDYPPAGKTKNNCPHSGIFGVCTRTALMAFQNKYRVGNKSGIMDEKTFDLLKNIYLGNAPK